MLGSLLMVAGAIGATGVALWLRRDRRYESSESVASAYDAWTEDRLLEQLWGEHVHLGHYGTPPGSCDFREAKEAFVHELVRWSGLDGRSRHQHQPSPGGTSHTTHPIRPELPLPGNGRLGSSTARSEL